MYVPTKFEINPLSCLSGNAQIPQSDSLIAEPIPIVPLNSDGGE